MDVFEEMSLLLQKGKAADLSALVQGRLDAGDLPGDILDKGLMAGINTVGEKFKNNEVFIPEVLIAARAMKAALEVLRPHLSKTGVKPIGKAVLCTVKGDLHDIGKNLVKIMLEGNGIECVDLGVDVDGKKVVEGIRSTGADLVCMSSLLTTTMVNQESIVKAIRDAGLRDKVKIMCGGAPVTAEFAERIGADAYADEAASAAKKAMELLSR